MLFMVFLLFFHSKELLLRAQMHPESEITIPQTSEMTSVADPFLGHTTNQADLHSRQESSDSGLGKNNDTLVNVLY